MKKIVKVLILVLIPLIASFLMGWYGYGYYSGGTQIKYDYYEDVEANTSAQLQAFMKYNEYKYEKTPAYKKVVTNPNNASEELLTFEIYRACYFGQKTIKKEVVDMELARYIFVIYNVNYDAILTLFDLTSSQIKDATTPTLKLVLTPNDLTEFSKEDAVTIRMNNSTKSLDGVCGIVDYNAKPTKADPDPFTASTYTSAFYTRWNIETNYTQEFGTDFTMTLEANTTYADETLDILDSENEVKPLLKIVNNEEEGYVFKKLLEKWENVEFVEGYDNNEKKAGYFWWVLGKYLWWICLITFVVIGGLTYTFVLVWEADDNTNKATTNKKKSVKKPSKK